MKMNDREERAIEGILGEDLTERVEEHEFVTRDLLLSMYHEYGRLRHEEYREKVREILDSDTIKTIWDNVEMAKAEVKSLKSIGKSAFMKMVKEKIDDEE